MYLKEVKVLELFYLDQFNMSSSDIEGQSDKEQQEKDLARYLPSSDEVGEALFNAPSLARTFSKVDEEDKESIFSSHSNKSNKEDNTNSSPPAVPAKVGFFHPSVASLRNKVVIAHLKIWLYLACLIIAAFSVYWGSLYNRAGNLHRLKMLVIIEDSEFGNIQPLIGEEIYSILTTDEFKTLGTWEIYNTTEAINSKFNNPTNISDMIITQVHHRNYWSAVHVYPNSTYNQYELYNGNTDQVPTVVQFVYESGRDISTIKPLIVPILESIQTTFQSLYGSIASNLTSGLSDEQKLSLMNNISLITNLPNFNYLDYRPYDNSTLVAPLQVGLIFLIIISFFLFSFFAAVHQILLPYVHIGQYLLYRIIGTHLSYLVLSLFISAVSAIFQINFTLAYGKAGFVVYWFSTYLTMAAVGGANENMAMLIFAYNPAFLGFWLISFVILNVSPSFSPIGLISPFYRYGYMMPIHNSNEISKVLFMNLWRGGLGLNYGLLVVWIVLNTILLPLILKHVGQRMAKKRAAEAAAAAADTK